MAYFKAPSEHLHGGTGENHKQLQTDRESKAEPSVHEGMLTSPQPMLMAWNLPCPQSRTVAIPASPTITQSGSVTGRAEMNTGVLYVYLTYYVLEFQLLLPVTYEGVSKSFRTGHLERELQIL
jgi:hypothetical protein